MRYGFTGDWLYQGQMQGGYMMNDLKTMVERGEISLRSAAYRLMRAGRCNWLPSDREVIKMLHIYI